MHTHTFSLIDAKNDIYRKRNKSIALKSALENGKRHGSKINKVINAACHNLRQTYRYVFADVPSNVNSLCRPSSNLEMYGETEKKR